MHQMLASCRRQPGFVEQALAGADDHRERRAQFIAGVASEFLLALDEGADAVDQLGDALRDQADFVVGALGYRQCRQMLRRDRADLSGQSRQRRRGPSRQPVSDQQRQREHRDRRPGQ